VNLSADYNATVFGTVWPFRIQLASATVFAIFTAPHDDTGTDYFHGAASGIVDVVTPATDLIQVVVIGYDVVDTDGVITVSPAGPAT
jgi:hypothetical protein